MNDYIDREALLKEIQIQRSYSKTSYPKQSFTVNDVLSLIKHQPAADVRPVVRGEWVETEKMNIWDEMTKVLQCSNCHRFTVKGHGITVKTKFCPNCGARMKTNIK